MNIWPWKTTRSKETPSDEMPGDKLYDNDVPPNAWRPVPQVFFSYARADLYEVIKVRERLVRDGFQVWMDREELLPGQRWDLAIFDAMRESDFILIFLSDNSVSEKSSMINREIRFAIDTAEERPRGKAFLIPVRLDNSKVPPSLERYQWIDIFRPDGYQQLLRTLNGSATERQISSKHSASEVLRDLLLNELSTAELRPLIYELPEVRRFYSDLTRETNQFSLVDRLLRLLESQDDIGSLVDWLRANRPELIEHYPSLQVISTPGFPDGPFTREPLDNPYIVGNPIQPNNSKVFLGRLDIANSILSELKKPHQRPSILLYGRRRMGKTSALLNIRQLARDPALIYVYVSGQSARFQTNRDFCYYMVQAIKEALDLELGDSTFFAEHGFSEPHAFDIKPIIALSEFFEAFQFFLEGRGLYCLIAVDEYEELDSHLQRDNSNDDTKYITKQLLLEIRDILQQRPRVAFIFAGTHYLSDLSKVDWSSIFINVRTLHVSFLSRRDSRMLLTRPVPGLSFQKDELIESVLDITGCQPLLLQAMASEIVALLNFAGKREVTKGIIESAVARVLRKQNTYFNYLWNTECVDDSQRELIKLLSRSGYSLGIDRLRSREEAVKALVRRELVRREGGTVFLAMPLLGMWLEINDDLL